MEFLLLGTAVIAGFLGSIVGFGGGIIVVPVLSLIYHVEIRYAIAASLISVVATSSGAAASYLRDSLTNLRLAVFLEVGTVSGAVVGFLISSWIESRHLFLLFGFFLLFSALIMLRKRVEQISQDNHPWSKFLGLHGSYPVGSQQAVSYAVERVPFGLLVMCGAGVLSSLLGIGSGIFKVLAMDVAMKVPIKVSSATSNFMIGVTASASAGAFLLRGDVKPEIAAPVALGVLIGSFFGARVMIHLPAERIRRIFIVVLGVISFQMILKGFRW